MLNHMRKVNDSRQPAIIPLQRGLWARLQSEQLTRYWGKSGVSGDGYPNNYDDDSTYNGNQNKNKKFKNNTDSSNNYQISNNTNNHNINNNFENKVEIKEQKQ